MTDNDEPTLTHIDARGNVQMVDVSKKPDTARTAVAEGYVCFERTAFDHLKEDSLRKGPTLTAAQLAGLLGAKETSRLIPLCHGLNLKGVDIELALDEATAAVCVRAFAKTVGPTGVEMEALTAVSVAALAVYDICRSVTRDIEIAGIRLLTKTGGQSGDYRRHPSRETSPDTL